LYIIINVNNNAYCKPDQLAGREERRLRSWLLYVNATSKQVLIYLVCFVKSIKILLHAM